MLLKQNEIFCIIYRILAPFLALHLLFGEINIKVTGLNLLCFALGQIFNKIIVFILYGL